MSVFTVGGWITKPGCEEAFGVRWREMAEWTRREVDATAQGTLLRTRDRNNRVVSFGPWPRVAVMQTWRALSHGIDRRRPLDGGVDGWTSDSQ